jgi:hypothetical protein
MMVRVNQAGDDDMCAGVEDRNVGRCRRAAIGYQLDDAPILNDEAALGAVGENGEWVANP